MVFFICSACGQSLKKNQVEKHCSSVCRQCQMVSCVDCGKEFWGNDFTTHIKCISEEEKYSGKLFKPKPGGNKGEVKQEAWTMQVQSAVERVEGDAAVKGLLLQIQECTNIPRKQAKFANFLKNSMRIRNDKLIERAWQAIQAEVQRYNNTNSENKNDNNNKNYKNNNNKNDDDNIMKEDNDDGKVEVTSGKDADDCSSKQIKNGAKIGIGGEDEEKDGRKKNKRKMKEQDEGAKIPKIETTPTDFSWSGCVHEILSQSPSQQLPRKKLHKKFMKEFKKKCQNAENYSDEKAISKLEKKLLKNSKLKIHNDIVMLTEQI